MIPRFAGEPQALRQLSQRALSPTAFRALEDPMTQTAETSFDIKTSTVPSFAALQHARGEIYESRQTFDRFKGTVSALGVSGEEGRRRGLGFWMSGEYQKAVEALRLYPEDNVASFTMARAHMAQNEFAEALPIFERLSKAYPDEPRPRAGGLE